MTIKNTNSTGWRAGPPTNDKNNLDNDVPLHENASKAASETHWVEQSDPSAPDPNAPEVKQDIHQTPMGTSDPSEAETHIRALSDESGPMRAWENTQWEGQEPNSRHHSLQRLDQGGDTKGKHPQRQAGASSTSPSAQAKSVLNDGIKTERSPFRRTKLSGLNLSKLKVTNLSRLLLDHSQLLLDDKKGLSLKGVGHGVMVGIAAIASTLTVLDLPWIQAVELDAQTFFFQQRGTLAPPQDLVIVEIDEASLDQSAFYKDNPEKYAEFAPMQQWPWQRQAYAIAIDRMMAAGAKAVALDLILDLDSVWGPEDDTFLRYVLERYPGRVVLASSFDNSVNDSSSLLQLATPQKQFLNAGAIPGIINYPFEADERIHQFAQVWLERQGQQDGVVQTYLDRLPTSFTQTFVEQTITAAQLDSDTLEKEEPKGNQIFFYGPERTFPYESFWTVLDSQNWEVHLRQNTFRDKIVLIGPTAQLFQDFHRTPFGAMPGIEIHANAIATYLADQAIADAVPNSSAKALLVLILTGGAGLLISRPKRNSLRLLVTSAILLSWAGLSYTLWSWQHRVLPTTIPLGAIALMGTSYVSSGLLQEKLRKLKLRNVLKQYARSPIVQDIISQQDDLQDLISEQEKETIGKQLDGRYKITEVLGAGGFGQTFVARDLHRPGQPRCVVKQLKPASDDPQVFPLARRLFNKEAEMLERLGSHEQIPQLLAYFEEAKEFYLVQELIEGHPLRYELLPKPCSELKVIRILKELLEILDFIHERGVIHRDIKPSNIIRRHSDHRLVLIDFGAVKESQAPASGEELPQERTVTIGTRGYIPSEQLAGSPRFSSDLYAVGIIGIQASTGLSPDKLHEDSETGELIWQDYSEHSEALKAVLCTMTRYNFKDRYQSACDVLQDLSPLLARYISDSEDGLSHNDSMVDEEDLWGNDAGQDDATIGFTGEFSDSTVRWSTEMRDSLDSNSHTSKASESTQNDDVAHTSGN